MTSKLKINLFGDGESLIHLKLPADKRSELASAATRQGLQFPDALGDPFYYHRLNDRKWLSMRDLNQVILHRGLLNTRKNQIEAWFAGKKVMKVKIGELLNEMVLFPLCNVSINDEPALAEGIYIRQTEVGLIASYETQTERFDIDSLQFHFIGQLMCGISHQTGTIKFKK